MLMQVSFDHIFPPSPATIQNFLKVGLFQYIQARQNVGCR